MKACKQSQATPDQGKQNRPPTPVNKNKNKTRTTNSTRTYARTHAPTSPYPPKYPPKIPSKKEEKLSSYPKQNKKNATSTALSLVTATTTHSFIKNRRSPPDYQLFSSLASLCFHRTPAAHGRCPVDRRGGGAVDPPPAAAPFTAPPSLSVAPPLPVSRPAAAAPAAEKADPATDPTEG